MESYFQGQRANQIFLMALLKEGRMRKDRGNDGQ